MKLKITLHGVAYEVDVEVLDASDEMQQAGGPLPPAPSAGQQRAPSTTPSGPPPPVPQAVSAGPGVAGTVSSPIAGTVLQVKCQVGDSVQAGQALVMIEAMKMETVIAAPGSGRIKAVLVAAGDSVRENQALVEFE